MKQNKHNQSSKFKIDKSKIYSLDEALDLIKKNSRAKFDESVEVHIHLGIDPKKSDQQIRSIVTLPHGTGKEKKIAAFITPEKIEEAEKAGADLIGGERLIKEIKEKNQYDFDIAVATPDMMRNLSSIAKILGPRGLMPSPKTGTVTMNIGQVIKELKKGRVDFRNDDSGNIHLSIGKISFEIKKLKENFNAFLEKLKDTQPESIKGEFIKNIYISSTMGPGIKISTS